MFDRTEMREATLAAILAAVTGYVDAVGFTRLFGVFPANQTGNIVLFGIALGDPDLGDAWRPALSMLAFALGVMLGLVLAHRLGARVRMGTLLALETVLIGVVALLAGDVSSRAAPVGGAKEVVMLGLAALAMGVQTDVIRRAARVGVWTTFTTGAMVQFTDQVSEAVVHHRSPHVEGRRVLVVLGAVLVAYVAGAAAGAAAADAWGRALVVPVVITGALTVWAIVSPSPAPPTVD